jgi:hypothetical protein
MWNQYRNIPTSAFYDIEANYTISGPPAPMLVQRRQPPPAGSAGRCRGTAQALQQVQHLDHRNSRTFCRVRGYLVFTWPLQLRLLQKTQRNLKNWKHLITLMCHCHDSGSMYMRCKTLATSLVGLIHGIACKAAASHPGPSESASGPGPPLTLASMNGCRKGATFDCRHLVLACT